VQSANAASTLGQSDWRLPNAKELQSIVDYTRSPGTTGSAAIDPVFDATAIVNEEGLQDWGFYWTSTTHERYGGDGGAAAYVCFDRGIVRDRECGRGGCGRLPVCGKQRSR